MDKEKYYIINVKYLISFALHLNVCEIFYENHGDMYIVIYIIIYILQVLKKFDTKYRKCYYRKNVKNKIFFWDYL